MNIGLHRSFSTLRDYQGGDGYHLLPLRLLPLDSDRYVVSNIAGNYQVMKRCDLEDLVHHRILPHSPTYDRLKANHFLADGDSTVYRDLLAAKYRTRQARLPDFTSLHLFVVTLRCDHTCRYCQVSRVSQDRTAFDMTLATADRAIALMLESPSPQSKVEFQGGEPLLNFDLIRHIVLEVERLGRDRDVQFVITSNLSPLTDEILEFAAAHEIFFSTSLDGAGGSAQPKPPPPRGGQPRARCGRDREDSRAHGA